MVSKGRATGNTHALYLCMEMYALFLSCPYASLHSAPITHCQKPSYYLAPGTRMSASIFSIWFSQDRLWFGLPPVPIKPLQGTHSHSSLEEASSQCSLMQECSWPSTWGVEVERTAQKESKTVAGKNVSGGPASTLLNHLFFHPKIPRFHISPCQKRKHQWSISDIKPESAIRNGRRKQKA